MNLSRIYLNIVKPEPERSSDREVQAASRAPLGGPAPGTPHGNPVLHRGTSPQTHPFGPLPRLGPTMEVLVDPDSCTGCGSCQVMCSAGAIEIQEIAAIDMNNCILCGACVASCPEEALAFSAIKG